MKKITIIFLFLFAVLFIGQATFANAIPVSNQSDLNTAITGQSETTIEINNNIDLQNTWTNVRDIEKLTIFAAQNGYKISYIGTSAKSFLSCTNDFELHFSDSNAPDINGFTGEDFLSIGFIFLGGAIYSEDNISIYGDSFSFTNNGNTNFGYGGAIYTDKSVIIEGNSFSFYKNKADSGGAIFADDKINIIGDSFSFLQNHYFSKHDEKPSGGALYAKNEIYIDGDYFVFSQNNSYNGGAIYSNIINITGDSFEFSNNTTSNDGSNAGGAIYASGPLTITGNSFSFLDNQASSLGGAIYARNNIFIEGTDIKFTNNIAEFGSAIYSFSNKAYDSIDLTKNVYFTIKVKYNSVDPDKSAVTFEGNRNLDSSIYNSIHFELKNENSYINATFDVENDAVLIMMDPMSSNTETVDEFGKIDMVKKGSGVWRLANVSNFKNTRMSFEINEGTLLLLPNAGINMATEGSVFKISNQGNIELAIGKQPSFILTDDTSLTNGNISINLLVNDSANDDLNIVNGTHVVFELISKSEIEGNNLTLIQPTTKKFIYGENIYYFTGLLWEPTDDNKNLWQLKIVGLSKFNFDNQPDGTGAFALVLPYRIALDNISILGPMHDISTLNNKNNWFESEGGFSQAFDAKVINVNFSAGIDSTFMNILAVGIFTKISYYDYKGTNIEAKTLFPSAGIYTKANLPYGFVIFGDISYGLNTIAQDRMLVSNFDLKASYLSSTISARAGLIKRITLGRFTISPTFNYQYAKISTKRYEEYTYQTAQSPYALVLMASSLDIHRLSAGLKFEYNNNSFSAHVNVFYLNNLADVVIKSKSSLVNNTSSEQYDIEAPVADMHNLVLAAGICFTIKPDSKLNIEYNGLFSKNVKTNKIKVTFSVKI